MASSGAEANPVAATSAGKVRGLRTGGILAFKGVPYAVGGPKGWRVANGKLVKDIETAEFRAALEYCRGLYEAGLVHPDAAGFSSNVGFDTLFLGRSAFYAAGSVGAMVNQWARNANRITLRQMMPFGHDGKAKPTYLFGPGSFGMVAVKKGADDRVKELLRIADFLTTPFGTTEYQARYYGVAGVNFNFDKNGNPVAIPNKGFASPPTQLIAPADPIYHTIEPDLYGKLQNGWQNILRPLGIFDPTIGLGSDTMSTQGAVLSALVDDNLRQIVGRKAPLSAFDDLIKEWRSRGGDKVRGEFEEALGRQ